MLASVTIPDGVEAIGDYAFSGCEALTEIAVPESVKKLGYFAFYNCTSLRSASIGGETIDNHAFYDCGGLIDVTFGSGVKDFGVGSFYGCSSLRTVYYAGTENEWNSIENNDYSSNWSLLDANIIFEAREPVDVNGDGEFNTRDIFELMSLLAAGDAAGAFDFNKDGKTNARDVTDMMRAIIVERYKAFHRPA